MDQLDVQVIGPDGRQVGGGRSVLPATLGRGANATVRFGDEREDVSRVHVEVLSQNGRLVAVDRSRNGTFYQGRRMAAGTPQPLSDSDALQVGDLTLRLQRVAGPPAVPDRLTAVVRTGVRHEHRFKLGSAMLAIVHRDGATFAESIAPGDPEEAAQRYRATGRTPYALLWVEPAAAFVMTTPDPRQASATLNRAKLQPGRSPIQSLDVVKIGDLRIEILEPGAAAIECINPECTLLNPYVVNRNCRWCGFKLQEGVTRRAAP